MIKKILITGATGYIGAYLAKELYHEGYEVHVITRTTSNLYLLEDLLEYISCHKYDGLNMDKIFERVQPDLVIHVAGLFVYEHKEEDIVPLIQSNILFGTYILEQIRKYRVPYFINTGTHWQQCIEKNNTPVNLYAATKEAFEKIAHYYIDSQRSRMITLKLIDTYGPFDPRGKILNLLKKNAIDKKQLAMSPGEQEIGLVYIDDVIKAFKIAIDKIICMLPCEHKEYCVAPQKVYTLKQIVHIFEEVSGKTLNVVFGERTYRDREVMKIDLGQDNILQDIVTISLEEGIRRIIDKEKW